MLQASDLVPSPWHISPLDNVTTFDELSFLGSETLQLLINKWIDEQYWVTVELQAVQETHAFLRRKTREALIEIASRHERLQFQQKVKTSDLYHMLPNPLLAGRESGSTSLNTCGWCAYARAVIRKESIPIQLKCGFYEAASRGEWLRFDDDCRLTQLTNSELLQLLDSIRINRQALELQVTLMGRKIEELRQLADKAERKPSLDACEPDDWYAAGNKVFVFVRSWCLFVPYWHFVAGVVQSVEDKNVVVQLNKKWRGHDTVTLPTGRPELLHAWEYDYLRSNVSFVGPWLHYFDRDFKVSPYVRALQ